MAKSPVKDLTDSVNHHFDQAVLRPTKWILEGTTKVGGGALDLLDKGKRAAEQLLKADPPPARRTTDIKLPREKGHKRGR